MHSIIDMKALQVDDGHLSKAYQPRMPGSFQLRYGPDDLHIYRIYVCYLVGIYECSAARTAPGNVKKQHFFGNFCASQCRCGDNSLACSLLMVSNVTSTSLDVE